MAGEIPTGEGWAWFDEAKAAVEKERQRKGEAREATKLAFEACFSSPAGQVVLDYMKDWIEMADGFDPALGFYNGAAQGFYREGMRRLFKFQAGLADPKRRLEEDS